MKIQRVLYIIIIMLACMSWAPSVKADSSKFTIEKYHVNISVTKENVYKIQEKITVNFTEPQHGIYRDIPKINEIYRQDGSKAKTIVELKSVSCGGASYQTKENEKNYQIKIGNINQLITGVQEYNITYDYVLGNDILKGNDEFYFNIIGTQWKTTIQNVTFEIHMPEGFSEENLGMVYGKNGSDQKEGLSYRVEGKSIYGELDPSITLQEGEGVTVRLVLPEGYFHSKFRMKYSMYIALGVGVFGVLFSFGLWWKIGRDDSVNVSMEYYPPNGMNSLEMAFAYKGNVNSTDVVSLVVYLAQKGYIQIWEGESKGDFVFKQLKQYDGSNEYEKMIMDGLFQKGMTVHSQDLSKFFYETGRKIIRKANSLENKSKLYHKKSMGKGRKLSILALVMFLFALVPVYVQYEKLLLDGVAAAFWAWLIAIMGFGFFFGRQKIHVKIMLGVIFGLLAIGDYCFYLRESLLYAGPECPMLYGLVYILCGIICFFATYMYKRNPYGTEIFGRVLGFKKYLETSSKEELKSMVMENPQYYYDILPYAYVFEISKKWMKKFKTLSVSAPTWYRSDKESGFKFSDFNRFMNNTMRYTSSMATSSSSRGGYSGGGSGGGGGGSW